MSQFVDLNYKIWGHKARNHLIAFYVADLFVSSLSLLAIIDFINLPDNAPAEAKNMVWRYIIYLPLTLIVIGCLMCLVFNINNRIFYGVISIFIFVLCLITLTVGVLNLLFILPAFVSKDGKNLKRKYYKITWTVDYFITIIWPCFQVYFGVILLKLSFLYPSQRVIVVIAKPASNKKEVSEGDSGPSKTGDSGNSGNTGGGTGEEEE